MLDSTAKITSGILSGNVNNYGDFDECINSKFNYIQGKYCLSEIHFEPHKHLSNYKELIMSNEPYRNEFDDVSTSTSKSTCKTC